MSLALNIENAAIAIKEADAIWIGAGAGMGVDSGLPDFRGNEGFWKEYPALKQDGLSFMDLANPRWFVNQPERAWGFYGHRYMLYKDTKPHKGFSILKKWCSAKEISSFVFTSNVDGHFQKAGFSRSNIYEIHGSINHLQCVYNCCADVWYDDSIDLDIDMKNLAVEGPQESLPRCRNCGGLARPNILMFGDRSWQHSRSRMQQSRYMQWCDQVMGKKLVSIELGAGTAIPTVRMESLNFEGLTIRINPRDAFGKKVIPIELGSLKALEKIDELLK